MFFLTEIFFGIFRKCKKIWHFLEIVIAIVLILAFVAVNFVKISFSDPVNFFFDRLFSFWLFLIVTTLFYHFIGRIGKYSVKTENFWLLPLVHVYLLQLIKNVYVPFLDFENEDENVKTVSSSGAIVPTEKEKIAASRLISRSFVDYDFDYGWRIVVPCGSNARVAQVVEKRCDENNILSYINSNYRFFQWQQKPKEKIIKRRKYLIFSEKF